jgi:hypothetical protein
MVNIGQPERGDLADAQSRLQHELDQGIVPGRPSRRKRPPAARSNAWTSTPVRPTGCWLRVVCMGRTLRAASAARAPVPVRPSAQAAQGIQGAIDGHEAPANSQNLIPTPNKIVAAQSGTDRNVVRLLVSYRAQLRRWAFRPILANLVFWYIKAY